MDSRGMLPAQPCKQCGKPLNVDGYHPAELYAGTFTGLCYRCERSGERLIHTAKLDGAQTWEFPPHCPSWRRDRERFIGYADCTTCKGKGRLWIGRSDAQGGSYSAQCEPCSKRYWNHPTREWKQRRFSQIGQAAQNLYLAELKKRKLLKAAKAGTVPAEIITEISEPLAARRAHAWKILDRIAAVRIG